ncbi:hypothetical protein CIK05_02935 [Bdellovibrio sp. qaytius]|nr:hypothetical protein CIK05_02935 [Bdellovibrio sp. qaytius]
MKQMLLGVVTSIALMGIVACAPVKFTKSDNQKIDVDGGVVGSAIGCDPRISPNLLTYTYASTGNPSLLSNCTQTGLNYEWQIKRSDSSVVSVSIPNLTGANPANIDLRTLGEGTYYIFLTARDPSGGIAPFTATTPLELVVPGAGTGNSLTCDPKINTTLTAITLNSADANPTITANCSPAAGSYIWTVTKDGSPVTIAGLSGASSAPNIKGSGPGVYRISLYATATGSAHWQTSVPLTVTVNAVAEPMTQILCNPKINGSLSSLTVTSTTNNPLISANCAPSDVNYAWTVTKNGQNVSVPALNDSNSNPDFSALGNGTYLIYLTATKSNFVTWSTTTPLSITVNNSGANNLTIDCSPRINADSTAVTITSAIGNPTVNANCVPNTVAYTWSVFRDGLPVTVSGLGGATSTPNFLAAGLGTYYVYLNAQQSGYNAYSIPTPLEVTVASAPATTRRVTLAKDVQVTDNKVDVVVIVDDSNSMLPDNRKLAERLQGFVSNLTSANIDWQMCATVTRSQDVRGDGVYYWGASRNWVDYVGSPKWILKTGAADPYSIFTKTIDAIGAGWAGTDDERGIMAAYWHAEYAASNKCYRSDASLSVIMISDEDVRSVGGDAAQVYYGGELKPLEANDLPQSYVSKIKQKFGMDKRFTVNSIIVKPGDSACMAAQDSGGSKSHYGYYYDELSRLTNGFSSSICENDYSANLNYFRDRIVSSLASIPLDCAPVGTIDVTVTPSVAGLSTRIENNALIFAPAVPAGHHIDVGYNCPRN